MKKELDILVTNDDGFQSKGIQALIEMVKPLGRITMVAPSTGQSGQAHAITVKHPIRYYKIDNDGDVRKFVCEGTPVDCVKIAFHQIMGKRPDLIVSGINHGGNASASVLYSGTMAAALEGAINEIPAIGFSILDHDYSSDFSYAIPALRPIAEKVINEGLPKGTCLNVNMPAVLPEKLKGIKICRQTRGYWIEEYDKRTDPMGAEYFWLTGRFKNLEEHDSDTDEWALENNYISIVPVKTDMTDYTLIDSLKKWNINL